ncbi:MAG: hypothetical protein KDI03_19355 [Anaerolineae bacterium]|nr:hypothetical protein [Anaerolineae bacterium]
MKHIIPLLAALALLLIPAAGVHAQSGGTFQLDWFTADGGGAIGLSGGTFDLGSTAGQPDAAAAAGGNFTLQGGFWNPSSAAPLAVTLASFTATTDGQQVLVSWETVSELDNAGFNLYRSETPDLPDDPLAFVPSQSPGSSQGHVYTYRDGDVEPGLTYWYWLQDILLSGVTTLHGPVSVTVAAPTAVRVASLTTGGGADSVIWLILAAVGLILSGWLAITAVRGQRRPQA